MTGADSPQYTLPSSGVASPFSPVTYPFSMNPASYAPVTIQSVYFNGFNLALSNADSSIVLLLDNQPQLKISMSFTTAKTLTAYLTEMIDKLEAATKHKIMKTDEVEAGLRAIQALAEQKP